MNSPTGFVILGILLLLYFLPTIVADQRRVRHLAGILILNLFLGWTMLGWIGALIWAVSDAPKSVLRAS